MYVEVLETLINNVPLGIGVRHIGIREIEMEIPTLLLIQLLEKGLVSSVQSRINLSIQREQPSTVADPLPTGIKV